MGHPRQLSGTRQFLLDWIVYLSFRSLSLCLFHKVGSALCDDQRAGLSLREKCPYSEFFWSKFSCIWTEYGEIIRTSPYSVRMRENMDQKNSEYGHFSRNVSFYIAAKIVSTNIL